METVKMKLTTLAVYMREAEEKNSPWNWAGVSSYELRYKTAWYEYVMDIKEICAKLGAKTAAASGARLETIANDGPFHVEYEAAGGVDPHEGHSEYTPTKTAFNLDKYHVVTELRACAKVLKDVKDVKERWRRRGSRRST